MFVIGSLIIYYPIKIYRYTITWRMLDFEKPIDLSCHEQYIYSTNSVYKCDSYYIFIVK